ncbi:MAG: DUF1749 domain-containing protein [bacterium]|nr:DUF1749 domain-containing protein [bacterium]
MIPVFLTSIKTKDNLLLEGIISLPKRKTKTALIWLHGLSSHFSRSQKLIKEVITECQKNDIVYIKFNTRGHDIASRAGKKIIGGGFEKFEECVHDISTMIRCARKLRCTRIFLAGHSTGANKALYYMYKRQDMAVKGLLLLGPISDRAGQMHILGEKKLARSLSIAEKLSKKNPRTLMPIEYGLFTARRFRSLYKAGTAEDVFPYHNPHARWKELASIRVPLAVIVGSRDQHLDRTATELINAFRCHATLTKRFQASIIKGADHSFRKKEKELAKAIIAFVKK